MSFFAILLNSNNINGAFYLYDQIINMYADPHAENSSRKLNSLLDTTDFNQEEIEEYLDEKPDD